VYRLKCGECPHIYTYIGQRGRPFKTRYKEHNTEIKNNVENSKFALHIQNTGHRCANIEETLDVLHVQRKGSMKNTLESYHVYEAYKRGLHLNEALIDSYNPILEIIIKNQPNKNLSTTYNQILPHLPDNPLPPPTWLPIRPSKIWGCQRQYRLWKQSGLRSVWVKTIA
jgi:hypothetical protein